VTRRRILFVVASTMTAEAFLTVPMRRLSEHYDVSLAANCADPEFLRSLGVDGPAFPIAIERAIRPWRDLVALWRLTALVRRGRFDAIHSVSPKAGLLAMAAGAMAGVPMRTHMFTGQVWATRTGLARRGLKAIDRLIHRLSTHSLVDSPSQRAFLLEEGVILADKSSVLGAGSVAGVDLDRFRPDAGARRDVRSALGLGEDDVVLLYVGRINADKGVADLARAFRAVHAGHPGTRLVLVGPEEGGAGEEVRDSLAQVAAAVRFVGAKADPERYMAAADLFCLPSYREGFGSVLIEAAACGVPALASRIYGITDAVEDGATGLLHPPRDSAEIARLATLLIEDAPLRAKLGAEALARARSTFSAEVMAGQWSGYYARL